MTGSVKLTGASSGLGKKWNSINWSEINARVQRLQMRIAKAVVEKRWNKVKSLQWLLTHSIEAKLLAVRRVTSRKGEELLVLTMWSGILQLAR
jgi:RNA-directed DNA polymerase